MNDIIMLDDWPQPSPSAPAPVVFADEWKLVLRYFTPEDTVAIVNFPHASIFQFGLPNDEALNGHPLYKNGLTSYAVHRVENSSWIQELEERNSVHDQHDRERFLRDRVHYVFTFHDSTLECVVTMGERPATEIHVCPTEEEANEKWKESIGE